RDAVADGREEVGEAEQAPLVEKSRLVLRHRVLPTMNLTTRSATARSPAYGETQSRPAEIIRCTHSEMRAGSPTPDRMLEPHSTAPGRRVVSWHVTAGTMSRLPSSCTVPLSVTRHRALASSRTKSRKPKCSCSWTRSLNG